jgi:heat-inducible transcriptional repressor
MTRYVDQKIREEEILGLVLDSYIKESKPISSGYLCNKYRLPYSTATVRNVLESLETKGFLSHIHTSSGRVPTKQGFKFYVEHLKEQDLIKENQKGLQCCVDLSQGIDELLNNTLDTLSQVSGYTSLVALSSHSRQMGFEERVVFRGSRFILQHPEFGDIVKLRNLFYALEVRIDTIHDLLLKYYDDKLRILIGDEIGLVDIPDCSLIVSGAHEENVSFALAVLGPMRMDYVKAASSLYAIKIQLQQAVEELFEL